MAEVIVATLTIDFTSDEEAQGTLMLEEIAEDEGGVKGDYVMYQGNIKLVSHGVIGGVYTEDGVFEKEVVDEFITFTNSNTTSIPYPLKPDTVLTLTPIGKVYKVDAKTAVVTEIVDFPEPILQPDRVTLKATENVLAAYTVSYTTVGNRYHASTSMDMVMVYATGLVSA